MGQTRNIRKIFKAKPTIEGAGVHLHRGFGFSEVPLFDPFLLLDDFRAETPDRFLPGFPWHPHRGIETITYVIRGTVEHGDSLGHSGVIAAGDVQWMTAGSGIVHQEMPKGDARGAMGGFQLWCNLPASHKMTAPRYRGVPSRDIPEVRRDSGALMRVVAGRVGTVQGPVRDVVTGPEYLDVTLPAQCTFRHATPRGHTVAAYVFEGRGFFCATRQPFGFEAEGVNYFDLRREPFIENRTVVLFEDGDELQVQTEDQAVRFLLFSGRPLHEPVAWYGPIVMNSQEELRIAFEEYRHGTFVRHRSAPLVGRGKA